MKISYWRQYEHGKISKDGVRTLVQAVEVAADSDDGRVNLDLLGTLWKPKVITIMIYNRTQTLSQYAWPVQFDSSEDQV